ncbi:MAG: hypothetical protein AAF418_07405, partial [Pseudomonadota bacterium]
MHRILVFAYLLSGLAASLVLPLVVTGLSWPVAFIMVSVCVLGCLVVHLALVIQHQIRLLQLHLASLKQSVERLVDDHYRVHQQLQKV